MKKEISLIKRKIRNNKTVVSNFSYLSLLQVFSLLFPFITYPYLLRVLGFDIYGKIIFAQVIVTNLCILVNFGFNVSGTNNIAVNSNNSVKLSEVVSSIYIIKFVIWLACMLIYFILIQIIPFLREDRWLYIIAFFISFNDLLFPVWFFQGIEKMKYITIINVGVRLLFLVLIFLFVKTKSDYLIVPGLSAIGALLGGAISLLVVTKVEKIKLAFQSFGTLRKYFFESLPLFVSSLSVQIYISGNKLLVGSFLGMTEVAIYDMGEKITSVLKIPIAMISQATFPKISREKNILFINKVMWGTFGLIFLLYGLVFVFSNYIVSVISGAENPITASILRILAFSSMPVVFNYFMGTYRLIPFGFKKVYLRNTVISSCFFLISVLILVALKTVNLYTLAYLDVVVETVVCLINVYSCYSLNLLTQKKL